MEQLGFQKNMVVEYYVGKEIPDLPSDVSNAQRDTNHPLIIQTIGKQLKIYMLQVSYLQLKQITSHLTR